MPEDSAVTDVKGEPVSESPEERAQRMRVVGALAGIPTTMAAGAVVGFLIGRWLDGRLGTDPWLQLVFLFLGFAASIRSAKRLMKRAAEETEKL